MYTQSEIDALQGPVSNHARVLYLMGLRPAANSVTATTAPLNYKTLLQLLNSKHNQFSLGREINELIDELNVNELVALPENTSISNSLNGQVLILPLMLSNDDNFQRYHHQHNRMTRHWQPDETMFKELASLLGIIDAHYNEQDVGEFIAYWLGRPDTLLSPYQWHQKFVQSMKMKRTVANNTVTKKVGTQSVTIASGIEADDNARRLVEKYANKSKSDK